MVPTVLSLPSPATTSVVSPTSYDPHSILQFYPARNKSTKLHFLSCCSQFNSAPSSLSETSMKITTPPPLKKTKVRYRKLFPGEKKGISEEMRFVAMRLRNNPQRKVKVRSRAKPRSASSSSSTTTIESENVESEFEASESEIDGGGETEESISGSGLSELWEPNVEGFVNYLVDSKLVFDTVERIVDQSSDVSYVYFRNTGLERSESLSKDLEWFSQQDVLIPEPSKPGISYVNYLEELAERSPPLFLSHFYNIYFSHIAGGQVVSKEVSKRLFEGRELEFSHWPGDEEELLRGMREKLNMLGEHWPRGEKNKCLVETKKAFRYLGQITRLIIL